MRWCWVAGIGLLSAGCAFAQGPAVQCSVAQAAFAIANDVRETSGLAPGIKHQGILWTHNDSGGETEIYGLGLDGTLRTRVRIQNATLLDWEDIEGGRCGTDTCLYIADIGDNFGVRPFITIYELSEPAPGATEVSVARVINASYPDGPQDAEAMFRLPSGDIYIVTKGRQQAVKLFRLSSGGTNERAALQLIRELLPKAVDERDRVTAATASPNGEWVAFRTYRTLYLYRTPELLSQGAPYITYSLAPLREKQGEALTLADDGQLWLSSEAENPKDRPTLLRLACPLK
jgi:hypothetical protein